MFHYLIYKNKELIEDQLNFDASASFNMEKGKIILIFFIFLEVGAALESVIPRAALGPFVSLNPSEKVT